MIPTDFVAIPKNPLGYSTQRVNEELRAEKKKFLDSLPNKPGKVITFEMREWAPLPPLPRSIFLMFKEDYKDLIDFFKEDNTNCICSSSDIFNFGCPSAHGKTCRSKHD